ADACFQSGRNALAREGHDGLLAFLASQLLFQDFSHRELFMIPHAALRTTILQELRLSYNELQTGTEPEALRTTILQELRLSYNDLQQLPDELQDHTCLRLLDLSENRLASFPPALSSLVSLKELNLSRNKIANTVIERKHAEE
ncbi:hypothetical protein T484DRAFT_1793388, partial [Baffinella frigidus]